MPVEDRPKAEESSSFHPWKNRCQYFYLAFIFFFGMLALFFCIMILSGYYESRIAELESIGACHIINFDWGSVKEGEI